MVADFYVYVLEFLSIYMVVVEYKDMGKKIKAIRRLRRQIPSMVRLNLLDAPWGASRPPSHLMTTPNLHGPS
jgi:hypothetical protein